MAESVQRRRFLASAAALSTATVAAGCSGPNPGRTGTTTTGEDRADAVGELWTGRSFRYLYAGAHVNAYTVTGDGPVFAFALVADGESPSLVLDGESHAPAEELPGSTGADAVFFDRDTGDRRVVPYSLPGPVDAESGSVAARGLTDDQLAFLADPPAFAVTDVSVPESVQAGGDATVTVTVENTGGSRGTFRAAATSKSISAHVVGSVAVPPGRERSVEVRVPVTSESSERVNYTWGSGGGDRTVRVES